ncbi:heterokaryon incompatibility protein-domain-containing protein [Truncatella angustata]|uniref:Heterokaryon incompatibility protein-domain-containing protein n=1 Tax=Truncatella angustata TaxID=152316 RepID=A0A9P8UCT2_9PEZI|nr:heterokaryon incompatibility protein-domain-containing protein [Truncatella angustata]KAH6647854.1 heterokaryon incompatibility protein-domain-containing protein [Truncatella angustata]
MDASHGIDLADSLESTAQRRQAIEKTASLDKRLGRQRELLIDFELINSWCCMCLENHALCKLPRTFSRVPCLRLVDINAMCIKEFGEGPRPSFAALSYVWGTATFLKLVKENLRHLKTPGSLEKSSPPTTIADAMTVCARLKFAYLWVDSLCIIQDDDRDMLDMVEKMNAIYTEADLTIFAASGTDAHSGLPGVRQGTRDGPEQRLLIVLGTPLIDSVDERQFDNYIKGPSCEGRHTQRNSPVAATTTPSAGILHRDYNSEI